MEELKEVRWKQRFENFHKSYSLLDKYYSQESFTELEQAGIIQIFEITFELAWKVLKDYLEADGYSVKSPRETIKQAFQNELINDGHIWLEALSDRNLATHTYDEKVANKMIKEIIERYYPEFKLMHDKLEKDL